MSPLTLTVLGCDGSHPGPGGAGSGYLVRDWGLGTAIWMDAGPGTFALLQNCIELGSLSAVVLTHEHADHWSDVEGLITAARWTMDLGGDPIPVLAAPGIRSHLLQEPDGVLDWREVDDQAVVELGGLQISFSRTQHPATTLAVRLAGPSGVVGYSADSGPDWPLSSLGDELDLALCEATFTKEFESENPIHMSGRQAGRNAEEARARRLVVTHRWSKIAAGAVLDEARGAFSGRLDTAVPGRGFSL